MLTTVSASVWQPTAVSLVLHLFHSKTEQDENPNAALQAIKYYNYSMKKKPTELFKPFVTEKVIEEESEEIEKCLGKLLSVVVLALE